MWKEAGTGERHAAAHRAPCDRSRRPPHVVEEFSQILREQFRCVSDGPAVRLAVTPAVVGQYVHFALELGGHAIPDAAVERERVDQDEPGSVRSLRRAKPVGENRVIREGERTGRNQRLRHASGRTISRTGASGDSGDQRLGLPRVTARVRHRLLSTTTDWYNVRESSPVRSPGASTPSPERSSMSVEPPKTKVRKITKKRFLAFAHNNLNWDDFANIRRTLGEQTANKT